MATKTVIRRYQGREKTSILQANTKRELEELIRSSRAFARRNGMHDFKVVKRGKDPDGGYRAIVTAHNWNPVKWVKEKIEARRAKGRIVDEDEVPTDATGFEGIVLGEKAREEDFKKEWEERQSKDEKFREAEGRMAERFAKAGLDYQEIKKQGDIGRLHQAWEAVKAHEERTFAEKRREVAYGHGPEQDIIERMSPKEQRKVAKAVKEAERSRLYGDVDIYAEEVPSEVMTLQRSYIAGHLIDRATGKPAPEPKTDEERSKLDWVPPGTGYTQVARKLTPIEQRQAARLLRRDAMQYAQEEAAFKDWQRERKPAVRIARGAASLGTGLMKQVAGAATFGIAGTAQAMLPRGRPSQARGLAPRPIPDAYAVRTPPVVGGMRSAPGLARDNLGHLRAAMMMGPSHLKAGALPGPRPTPPARRIPLAGRPRQIDLSGLRKKRTKGGRTI